MKRSIFILSITTISLSVGGSGMMIKETIDESSVSKDSSMNVDATMYCPSISQCDSTPLITENINFENYKLR